MASPLLIAALCMGKRQRKFFLFCFAGMGVCLLSAYINTFFAALYKADTFAATTEIAPVVEEVMKLLPLLFYLLIFEPKREQIKNTAVVIALSFATFENVCYLIQNGAGHFSFIFFRGIGTGAMHVICGAIVGGGLAYVWQRTWLKIAGTCGLLGAAITFHAIYNLLIAYGGAAQYIAYLLPVLILAAGKLIFRNSIRFSVSYMPSILLSQKSPKKSFTYIGTKKAKNSHLKIKFFQKNLRAAETAPKSGKSGYIIVLNCGRSVFPLPGSVQATDKQYTVLHCHRRSEDYKLREK